MSISALKNNTSLLCFIIYTKSFVIFKGRYGHGMGVISENTAYRSVLVSVSVSVDKFSFVLGIESIGIKWYQYIFTDNID